MFKNSQVPKIENKMAASSGDEFATFEGQNYRYDDTKGANTGKDGMAAAKDIQATAVNAEDKLEYLVAAKNSQAYDIAKAKEHETFQAICTDDVMTAVRNNKENISAAARYGMVDDSDAASSLASHTLAGPNFNKIFKRLNIKK